MLDAVVTSGPGWDRFLSFDLEGTYALWERDSVGDDLRCHGRYMVHRYPVGHTPQFWVELQGCRRPFDDQYQIFFEGRDTLKTYPGGSNKIVFDALMDKYVRDSKESAFKSADAKTRARGSPRHVPIVKAYVHTSQSIYLNQAPTDTARPR